MNAQIIIGICGALLFGAIVYHFAKKKKSSELITKNTSVPNEITKQNETENDSDKIITSFFDPLNMTEAQMNQELIEAGIINVDEDGYVNKELNRSISAADEEYVKYVMSHEPKVTRDDVIAFLRVLDTYDRTNSKERTFMAFDSFIEKMGSSDPLHAIMVNGFFCGLLGSNLSLSNTEVDVLAKKNTPMLVSKLNSK